MRFCLLVVVLSACAGQHRVRLRLVDAESGEPRSRAQLRVRVDAYAHRDSSWCRHGDSWVTTWTEREPPSADWEVTLTRAETDRAGWVSLAIPREYGYCRFRPRTVSVYFRDAVIGYLALNRRDRVIAVFESNPPREPYLGFSPFVRYRAAAGFSKEEAIRSVHAERTLARLTRASEEEIALVAADDGGSFLVGTRTAWKLDPWATVSLATARRVGRRWRVELRRLEVELHDDGLPRHVLPAGFTSAGAREAARSWATQAVNTTIWRSVVAAKLIDDRRLSSVLPNKLVGAVDRKWDVRIATGGSSLTAWAIGYTTDGIVVAQLHVTLGASERGTVTVSALDPIEIQVMAATVGSVGDDGQCAYSSEATHGGPTAFYPAVAYLEASRGTIDPGLRTCSPAAPTGCVVGTDRESRTWRARCWHDAVHDHPLFEFDQPLRRARFWHDGLD